ncbi:hypothetical protein [Pantoea sp. Morm]|uniref:hypothetical protein n=1 Tax=Pantoea sp. Morm TaxID=2601250 RepID=UPI0031FCF3A8
MAIIDRSVWPKPGDTILFEAYGTCHIGRLGPDYIICEDGETYEGEALEDISVIGVQMWNVVEVCGDAALGNRAAPAPAASRGAFAVKCLRS